DLHGLELELARVVHVEEPGDPLGGRVDVVADPRVRIALDLFPEQGSATVEVLLDGGDLEVGIDLHVGRDQLAVLLQVFQGAAPAGDVFFGGFHGPNIYCQTFCLSSRLGYASRPWTPATWSRTSKRRRGQRSARSRSSGCTSRSSTPISRARSTVGSST